MIGSLFGLGGGILIVPVLVIAMKIPMHNAVATSLMCVIATSSAAASRNVLRGVANVKLGMTLELCTVVGAMVGGSVAGILSGDTLTTIFALTIMAMAIPMARGVPEKAPLHSQDENARTRFVERLDGSYFDDAEQAQVTYRVRRLPFALGISSLAGLLSGLLGVGGGIVKVPALTLFCDVPMKAAAATSNFMIGVTAAASAVIYYGRGEISALVTAASVIGVFIGSRSGASIAARVKGQNLRRGFAIVMVVIGIQLLLKGLGIAYR